ncbi:MAG: hypothetical protein LBE78_04255 [Burkholderiaceae bacterium]|jgi:hypothetical protein|nr:hypothetical protein [Burkholderiaceae bacterium]
MNKITQLATATLYALALTACGGGDDGDGGDGNVGNENPSPSIAACFSAPKAVSYDIASSNPDKHPIHYAIETGTFNNLPTTIEKTFYKDDNYLTEYWQTTSNAVALVAIGVNEIISANKQPIVSFPLDMQPGQSVDYLIVTDDPSVMTFVGFQTLTLNGRTFANTCHFKISNVPDTGSIQVPFTHTWYAPGYGSVKQADDSETGFQDGAGTGFQYAGGL